MRESMATGRSGRANSNHEPHGCGLNSRSLGPAVSRSAAVMPGGALPTTPAGASRPGSIGRQTGSSAIPASDDRPGDDEVEPAHQRRAEGLGLAPARRPVRSPSTPAIAATAPSGHQATPRIA